jgi:hypothetical protein
VEHFVGFAMIVLVPSSFSGPLALSLALSLSGRPLIAAAVGGDVTILAGLSSGSTMEWAPMPYSIIPEE